VDLDHVAIATEDVTDVLNTLVGQLGTPVIFGGANIGFRAMQVAGGDLRIELLEPFNIDQSDFLRRFLDANGEGPHHLTFKTDDIEREIERVKAAGYTPVGVNISMPFWREMFIHPKEAGGTVIQIAQSEFGPLDFEQEAGGEGEFPGGKGPGKWWPDPPEPNASRAILRRVVITTDEMARALALYQDLLGGQRTDHGEGWAEFTWGDTGRIRLESAAGRPEGINRLEWTYDGPQVDITVAGTLLVLYPDSSPD
jgi:catechol 2,3-dioxygenase-like lactoylglutathione lyase family enzyme